MSDSVDLPDVLDPEDQLNQVRNQVCVLLSDSVDHLPVLLDPEVQVLNQETRDIEKRFESIAMAIGDCNGADTEVTILIDISKAMSTLLLNGFTRRTSSNGIVFSLQEESLLTIMKFLGERTHWKGSEKTLIEDNMSVLHLLEELQFRESAYSSAFFEYALKWLEDRWVIVSTEFPRNSPQDANSVKQGARTIIKILNKLLVCDKERSHETRILKLFWNHASDVSEIEQAFRLSEIAKHYSSNIPKAGGQEEFLKMTEDQASFLHACSIADKDTTSFYTEVNGALNQTEVYGQIARCWVEKEENLHTKASSCELAYAFSIDFTETARLNTAKMCLDRLDFAKKISSDLNPYNSDTFASVMDNVMSPELTSLNALKKETKLRKEAIHQVEKISEKHRQAYEAVKKQQYERFQEIFQARQKEVEDVVREALYKKEKYLASVAKESISSAVTLTSEDVLKKIVQQAGGALKLAEGKQEAHRLEKAQKSEFAVCYLEFTKKRKRACLDPCGHVNACFSCATKAWETKPNCPLCRVRIEKPIPLPAQLFF
ncbi:hypothetical protein KC19_1G312100 [Ceratodon purpureus]|uniref:RING-type domain-containing protein n=1 Tax=Ceratodon purpureus TaxID=3225 RepID=A0A8T0JDX9_CERPU|nr:hypothetical protein KC19_1G312100 [Ceratodon purpureus]